MGTHQRIELERRERLRVDGRLPDHPVILPRATAAWPAVKLWTPEYFAQRVGHRRVTIDGSEYAVLDLLERIERSTPEEPAPYLRTQKLVDVFPELAGDLEPMIDDARPNWAESRLLPSSIRRGRLPEILLGGRGAGFHVLHYDKDHLHAFISQLYGPKELFLFSPEQSDRLYPKDTARNQSSVDIHDPDLDRHPRFAEAVMQTATLMPGETVYMPPGWWHTTRMHETSISVTWNTIEASNWADFATDTRRRVARRTNPAIGAVFGVGLAAFGLLARGRERIGLAN